jgi:hypothetical protein
MANRYGYPEVVVTGASNSLLYMLRYSDAAYRMLGQDFQIPVNKKLKHIKISMKKYGDPTGNIWVKIYEAGANPTAGTLVATSDNIDVSTLSSGSIALTTVMIFSFSSPPTLSANTQYYWVVDGDFSISTTNYVGLFRNNTSIYANGQLWTNNAGTWASYTSDFQFSIYTDSDGGTYDIESADVTGVANLRALKGADIAASETVYINSYRNLTIQTGETLSLKQIVLGDTSTGAAVAGQRAGILTFQAGSSFVPTGDATAANSGIVMNPTSADSSSKDCRVYFNGASGSRVVITNSVNSYNTSYQWAIANYWGTVSGKFYDLKWSSATSTAGVFSCLNVNADRTTATECILDDGYVIGSLGIFNLADNGSSANGLIPFRARRLTVDGETSGTANNIAIYVVYIVYNKALYQVDSLSIDLTDLTYIKTANTNGLSLSPVWYTNSNADAVRYYYSRFIWGHAYRPDIKIDGGCAL